MPQTAGMDAAPPAFARRGAGEELPFDARRRRCGPRGAPRRAGGPARAERGRQDHDAAHVPRHHHPRRGLGRDLRPPPAQGPEPGHGARRLRRRLPAAARPAAGARGPRIFADLCGAPDRRGRRRRRARALRHPPPGRPDVRRAVLGPADDRRHRQGHAPPAVAARARRADRLARPRRRLPGAHRPRGPERRGRHVAARHQPQHGRGRAPLRAGGLPPAARSCRRHPRRDRRRARPRDPSRTCSSTSPPAATSPGRSGGQARRRGRRRERPPGHRPSPAATPTCCCAAPTASSTCSSGRWSTCCCGARSACSSPSRAGTPSRPGVTYLLAGILLFHVVYQSQIAVSTGFLEEIWSRNLLNLMTTPLKEWEYAVGRGPLRPGQGGRGASPSWSWRRSPSTPSTSSRRLGPAAHRHRAAAGGLVDLALRRSAWCCASARAPRCWPGGSCSWSCRCRASSTRSTPCPRCCSRSPACCPPPTSSPPPGPSSTASRSPWDQLAYAFVGAVVLAGLGVFYVTSMLRTFRQRGYVTRFAELAHDTDNDPTRGLGSAAGHRASSRRWPRSGRFPRR